MRADGERVALRARVHGRVQGVFFRDSTRRVAARHGVAGWVANRPDGSVEALLEGTRPAVEAVLAFCREGPRGASVARVEVQPAEPEGLGGFEVR
jgi:acylphosphatase